MPNKHARSSFDSRGLEGMPLRLLISAVILAIIVPTAWAGLSSYTHTKAEADMQGQLDLLTAAIHQVYFGGPGNMRNVEVRADGGAGASLEYLRLGDALPSGGDRYLVRFKFDGRPERVHIVTDPSVMMTSPSNSPLELGPGHHTLRIECLAQDYGTGSFLYILVSEVG